jgi:hypothetical protein
MVVSVLLVRMVVARRVIFFTPVCARIQQAIWPPMRASCPCGNRKREDDDDRNENSQCGER